jgi:predicted deacylase
MFAAFFTGNEKLRVAATILLLTKYIDDPSNPYRRELLEFKFRNRLFNVEEMEEVLKMSSQMTERDRVQMEEFLRNHPFIQKMNEEMNERIRVESEAKGEIKAKQDAIFKFLARRFGAEIAGLQQKVQQITSIEVLDRIMEELFAANTLEETRIIISGDPGKSIQ